MQKKRSLKRVWVLPLVILACLVVSFVGGLLFWQWYAFEVKEVPIEVTVTNTSLVGFNTGTDKLYFGTITPDGFSERRATVVTSREAVVVIKVEGQVAGWVSVSENNIRVQPNERKDVVFRLASPADATPGNYTGTAIIQYHRPLW